jgi:mxaA protein
LAWLQATVVAAAAPFAYAPEVFEPRSAGHFVGDVLTQRIALDSADRYWQPSSLPPADRVGLWFQRLASRIDTDAAGRHFLVIDYQIINSPLLPVSVALPALTLATRMNAPLKVASWPIEISPLAATPAYANVAPLPLRPDRLAAPLPTGFMQRRLLGWTIALAAVLAAWLGWALWQERRDSMRLPFARALRQLEALGAADDPAAAWICLHRALNATAGRAIQEDSLAQLFAAAPQLEPLRAELVEFLRRSRVRFFARSRATVPATVPFPLVDLCRKLRALERRAPLGRRGSLGGRTSGRRTSGGHGVRS